ncbi:hypothetical protein [Pseudodesulfovibrio senegalensis]|uniref:Uncharacterized protein n=1 Tax=Pseudodesulfovibrio senegalensis TaxID=1721087 RepID=A0A6N6N0C8_9BACT|nr:hypothetical protein [Pseudodesulfovibrio senegalensis]KAB1440352.1 hypothetical protein F8A88_13980 [Pseudodesulfovibrio senegalensis]
MILEELNLLTIVNDKRLVHFLPTTPKSIIVQCRTNLLEGSVSAETLIESRNQFVQIHAFGVLSLPSQLFVVISPPTCFHALLPGGQHYRSQANTEQIALNSNSGLEHQIASGNDLLRYTGDCLGAFNLFQQGISMENEADLVALVDDWMDRQLEVLQ